MSELFNVWFTERETELMEEYMEDRGIASMEAFNEREAYELFVAWCWDRWVEEGSC